ncbi:kinesin-like protein KIF19 [Anabrus simplex]|uniref:kinesin-like protein KIF19 n=1 Tax=Anabrus simplex TaxID=316456 RepID=UPI0035A361AA
MSHQQVAEWCRKFAAGREKVTAEDRSGRPSTASTDLNTARVEELIQDNRRITLRNGSLNQLWFLRSYHFTWITMVAVRIRPLKQNEGSRVLHMVDHKAESTFLVRELLIQTEEQYSAVESTNAIAEVRRVDAEAPHVEPASLWMMLHDLNLAARLMVVLEDDGDKNDVLRQKRGGERRYVYDVAFGEESTQEEVYEHTTRSLVQDVLVGYNATVFAYGATGSGKTHTMVGSPQQPGIMVRALNDLFQHVRESPHPEHFVVTMSYLEIYNENIRDLLNPSSGFLELREDPRGRNIQVAGLFEISTTSTEEVMRLLQKGNRARTVEPTAANKTSSRSHALLSVTVRQTSPLRQNSDRPRARVKQGRLFMIDLAGSERASQTKNRGKRLQEGAHINRSLLALGNCINALSGGARYVNYRDSKLTRLLKDALSGNCRTVMVAHVSPAVRHKEESRNTLLYADRAKNISNKVERNILDVSYHVSQYRAIISELRAEIARLRTKMQEERPRSGDITTHKGVGTELKLLRDEIVTTFKEQMRLRRHLMELDSALLGLAAEAERQHLLISQWESQNNKLYKNQRNASTRWRQEQRPNTDPELDMDRDSSDTESPGDNILHQAWTELAYIEKEQERYAEMRAEAEKELEDVRKHGIELENELPSRISSDEERELLALMCRVHELEVEKMALQSERLIKQHELRRRDILILRYDRQRQLCEEIITRQRQLMEEGCLSLPPDLQELYRLYQREIHAATYNEASPVLQQGVPFSSYSRIKEKLPPISKQVEPLFQRSMRFSRDTDSDIRRIDSDISLRTPSSSAGSDYSPSPLPPITGSTPPRPGQLEMNPPPAVLFPPIGLPNRFSTEIPRSGMRTGQSDPVRYTENRIVPTSRLPRPQHRRRLVLLILLTKISQTNMKLKKNY